MPKLKEIAAKLGWELKDFQGSVGHLFGNEMPQRHRRIAPGPCRFHRAKRLKDVGQLPFGLFPIPLPRIVKETKGSSNLAPKNSSPLPEIRLRLRIEEVGSSTFFRPFAPAA